MNSDYTICLDGDLQHPPELIPNFIEKIKNHDIVIGKRRRKTGEMPFIRILSNSISSFLLGFKLRQTIYDSQCGYRALKTKKIIDILPETDGFESETEMLIKAARKNYSIGWVEIPAIYGNEKSKMTKFKTTLNFIYLLLK